MGDTTNPPIPVELEAKLLVPTTAELRAIGRLTQLGPYRLQPRGTVRLHSSYLDTPSLTLARNGVALRLRRQGRNWEATMKWAGRVNGDVHERPELTVALPGTPALPFLPPPGPLRTQLVALVAGRPLIPILISEIQRQLFDVLPPDPAASQEPIAELALDRVRLHGPDTDLAPQTPDVVSGPGFRVPGSDKTQRDAKPGTGNQKPGTGREELPALRGEQPETTYCEVEIECRHGERKDITSLARVLRHNFGLLPSRQSKFARGLTLLYGSGILGGGDQRVLAYDTMQVTTRRIVARQLHWLRLSDPGTRLGDDPEALHDMRVATRRLRAAVRLFAAGMPARLQSRMTLELRWLGETLAGVRDLDVQLAKLDRFTTAAPAGFRPALDCLREYLDGERTSHRNAMLTQLDTERYRRLLIQLERFAESRAPQRPRDAAALEPVAHAGRRAIKKAFRRLRKRGEHIDAMPRPEDLHALRIRAKRLRYLLEFLQELTGKAGRRLVKHLTALQDLLGSYHDAVVAADFVRRYVEEAGAQLAPASMVALGALVASELRLAEQKRGDFEETWRRFTRKRTLDARRDVLRKLRSPEPPSAPDAAPPPHAPPAAPADAGDPS